MGLFDSVWMTMVCPQCGKKDFVDVQTKDFACEMRGYEIGDVIEDAPLEYHWVSGIWVCENCKKVISAKIITVGGVIWKVYNQEDFVKESRKQLRNKEVVAILRESALSGTQAKKLLRSLLILINSVQQAWGETLPEERGGEFCRLYPRDERELLDQIFKNLKDFSPSGSEDIDTDPY